MSINKISFGIIIIFCLAFVKAGLADEISDLKEQIKIMQDKINSTQKKIELIEVEKSKNLLPSNLEDRLISLEQKIDKGIGTPSDKIKITGSLWEYYFNENNCYFGNASSRFLETSAKIGVKVKFDENLTSDIQLSAQGVAGEPHNYTGVTTDNWEVEAELANFTIHNILDKPFSVTVGRQNLEYGDGFLVYDGYTDPRANWSSPVRSFYATKGVYEAGPIKLEGFAAIADQDYRSYETYLLDFTPRMGRRYLYGTNLRFEKEKYGIWDLGVFIKNDKSELESNTLAISQRGFYTFDFWPKSSILPKINVGGEIVKESGQTKVKDYALTQKGYDRSSLGGHLDATLYFAKATLSPYFKTSYIHLPGDDPDTDKNEAFDPIFYGFKDWGRWFIGSLNSYNLFNYNEKVMTGELGLSPTKTTLLRGIYYYFTLDRQITTGAGKKWAHEFNLIFDYFPKDWFFIGAEFGYTSPLNAAKVYSGSDKNSTEYIIWTGINF